MKNFVVIWTIIATTAFAIHILLHIKKTMQANVKRVHIISRYNGGWAVKKQGASRALKVYPTKEDAVIGSYPFLQLGYDLVIHRKDGSVEQFKKADATLAGFSLERNADKAVATARKKRETDNSSHKKN